MSNLKFDVSEKEFRTRTINLIGVLQAGKSFAAAELEALATLANALDKKDRGLCNLKALPAVSQLMPMNSGTPLVGTALEAPGIFQGCAFPLSIDFNWSIERNLSGNGSVLVPRINEPLDPNPIP